MNALGGLDLGTGDVRASDGKGRHTTSASSLHAFEDQTQVIDTPGVRSLGLDGVDARLLAGDLNLDLDLDKRRDLFTDDEYRDVLSAYSGTIAIQRIPECRRVVVSYRLDGGAADPRKG